MTTEKSMRMLTAEEQTDVRRNLAVPSPILSETDPILVSSSTMRESSYLLRCICDSICTKIFQIQNM